MRAVVFDLDGTLLDTLADLGNACNIILERHGFDAHPIDAYRQMVGNGFEKLVRRALPADAGLSDARILDFVTEAKAWYAAHMMDETIPYPGIEAALEYLIERDVALAVLSNKPDDLSQILIRRYFPGNTFKNVQGALPDRPLKPDPCCLSRMLDELAVPACDAAYVGDSNVDMVTAHNAKTAGVGATWGFRGMEELEKAGADILLTSPEGLKNLAPAFSA